MTTPLPRRAALGAALVGAALAALAAPAIAQPRAIVVASKIDTEGGLLGQMMALLLEGAGLRVENRVPLGPTRIVRAALLAGEIDLYPEYTGNGAFFFQMEADPAWRDARAGSSGCRPRPPTTPGRSRCAPTSRARTGCARSRISGRMSPRGGLSGSPARPSSSRAPPRCPPSSAPTASPCRRSGCWC